MRLLKKLGVVVGGLVIGAGLASAQLPGAAPAAPAGAVPAAAPGAAAAAAGAPKAGFFARACVAFEACRRKICATPAGAMLNNATKPLSALTGGIFPSFCPIEPSLADLAKPGVAGTADAIKKDALEAKMRRDKVRFLGTVDCRYYPDAVGALVAALRTDGSECVRFEAALALGRGCCCNEKTIKALEITVAGSEKDGNPAERSVRVRCAAAIALEHCLSCYVPPPVEQEPIKGGGIEGPGSPEGGKTGNDASGAPSKLPDEIGKKKPELPPESRMPSKQTVEEAWATINEFNALLAATRPQAAIPASARVSVYQLIKNASGTPETVAPASYTVPAIVAPSAAVTNPASTGSGRAPTAMPTADPTRQPMTPAMTAPKIPATGGTVEPRPAPMVMPAAPVTPPIPAAAPVTSAGGSQVPAPPTAAAAAISPVVTQVLKGETPAERHAAIRQLVKFDWKQNPVVASALLAGAKSDPAPIVRVDCLRHLAAYQMTHPQVLAELGAITQDADPWVRDEAAKALEQLKQKS